MGALLCLGQGCFGLGVQTGGLARRRSCRDPIT